MILSPVQGAMDNLLDPVLFPKTLLQPQEVPVQVDGCSDISVCSLISNSYRNKRNARKKIRSWSISSKESDSGSEHGAMSESKGSGHVSSDGDGSRRRSRSRRRRRRRKRRSRSSGSSSSDSDSDSSSERRARRRRRRRKQRKNRRSRSKGTRRSSTSEGTSSTGSTSRSGEREQARRRQRSVDSYGSPLRSRSPDRRHRRSRRDRSSNRSPPRTSFTGDFGHGQGVVNGPPGNVPERRVYVGGGGLPGVGELAVADLFSKALLAAMTFENERDRRRQEDLVLSVYLNPNKPFGFVELASAALATATLQLDGLLRFHGQAPLRIRRPTDYRAPLHGDEEPPVTLDLTALGIKKNNTPSAAEVGVSDQVPDGPFKVFIGGLPYHMSDGDVQTMLTAAGGGPLRALRVVKDQTPHTPVHGGVPMAEGEEKNRGFGFCQFCEPECARRACQALNGLVLPGAGTRVLSLRMGAPGSKNKGNFPPQHKPAQPLPLNTMPPNPLILMHRLAQAKINAQVESASVATPSLSSCLGLESSPTASAMKVSRPATPAAFS